MERPINLQLENLHFNPDKVPHRLMNERIECNNYTYIRMNTEFWLMNIDAKRTRLPCFEYCCICRT